MGSDPFSALLQWFGSSNGGPGTGFLTLGRYAALCQEQGLVPIVEPEVRMDGSHTIDRCEEMNGHALHTIFNALYAGGFYWRASF
ncbi:MAG TPA: class I fructose-bisphosphate aldolase [Nitrospirales bacterium]|nr:class I fructose-bisphosphate aldolase [Nitrospirales bacterium]